MESLGKTVTYLSSKDFLVNLLPLKPSLNKTSSYLNIEQGSDKNLGSISKRVIDERIWKVDLYLKEFPEVNEENLKSISPDLAKILGVMKISAEIIQCMRKAKR